MPSSSRTNPISKWILSGMEDQDQQEREFEDRVAEMSICSAKLVEQRSTSKRYSGHFKYDPRTRGFDHFFFAHSTLKGTTGGINSSAFAMDFYNDQAERRLAQIMKDKQDKA